MTPVRTPDVVRGDVPGLLTYAVPVTFTAEGIDGERIECTGVVLDTPEPNTSWRVANLTDGVPADLYGDETREMCLDWTSPLAIYAALHWLADRGHPSLWMLPATHGGKVSAHAGLTAWEVSAILVARSVGRVAGGLGAVQAMFLQWQPEEDPATGTHWKREGEPGVEMLWVMPRLGWQMMRFPGPPPFKGPETGVAGKLAADRAALADGCAILAPGGILLPD